MPSGRLRVLLVADSLHVGGAERHVVGLAAALVAQGHRAEILCSVEGGLAPVARRAGVPVHAVGERVVKRRLSLSFARGVARASAGGFDLVHAHMYASAGAAALAGLGRGIPLVITEHSEAGWRGRGARLCARWVYRRAAQVIAVSHRIGRRLIAYDHVQPTRVRVILNGLPPSRFAPEPAISDPLPVAFADRPLVGAVARLQREKGLADFIGAAAMIAPRAPSARFVVVGDGPQRRELGELAHRLGLGERLVFLGFQVGAPALIARFDVLVVPSLSEGSPLVVLEAMAAGVPIVATAVGGIPEQVRHGQEALLVPPSNPAALAGAVLELVADSARAQALADAGRQRLREDYAHDVMVRRTVAVYESVLRRPLAATERQPSTPLLRV